jgi:hypothetical protein
MADVLSRRTVSLVWGGFELEVGLFRSEASNKLSGRNSR